MIPNQPARQRQRRGTARRNPAGRIERSRPGARRCRRSNVDSRAGNTRAQYRIGMARVVANGPHSPATRRCQPIRSPSPPTLPSGLPMAPPQATVRTIRAAIRAGHVDTRRRPIRPAMMASAAFCRASPAKRPVGAAARPIRSPLTDCCAQAIIATASGTPGAPGAAWNRKRPQPTGAPPIKALVAVACSRVACAGRKRRRCAGRTYQDAALTVTRHRGLRPPVENRSGRHRGGRALSQERVRRERFASSATGSPYSVWRVAHRTHVAARCSAASTASPSHGASLAAARASRRRRSDHRPLRARRPCRRIDQARRTTSRRRPRRAGGSRHGWLPTTRRPSQPSTRGNGRYLSCRGILCFAVDSLSVQRSSAVLAITGASRLLMADWASIIRLTRLPA